MTSLDPTMLEVERAVLELRRRQPVVIFGPEGAGLLVAAAERMDTALLSQLKALSDSPPILLLTAERAVDLRLRPYSDPVMLALPGAREADFIGTLVDPTADLSNPLRGPFTAEREGTHPLDAAAIELAKISEVLPAVVRLTLPPQTDEDALLSWAGRQRLITVSGGAITDFRKAMAESLEPMAEGTLTLEAQARLPVEAAVETRAVAFRPKGLGGGGPEFLALVVGRPSPEKPPLVRLHSECFTGDLLGSLKCDCGTQLRGALTAMALAGAGVLLYLPQEGRGIGLMNKFRAYALQDQGFDTVDANTKLGFRSDERRFLAAARMLTCLGYQRVRLLTNNPDKVSQLQAHGITVVDRVAHSFPTNPHNENYLATKAARSGHLLPGGGKSGR